MKFCEVAQPTSGFGECEESILVDVKRVAAGDIELENLLQRAA